MALTQISTAGVKDDAVTSGKIPANAVGSSEIADEAVTLAKLPHGTSSNDGKFLRANNGADPTFETVNTNLVADTSPQLGGNLDVNGRNILFGHASSSNDDTLKFGTNGDDLKISHGGAGVFSVNTGHAYIRNTGDFTSTRKVYIMAKNDNQSVTCNSEGSVELYNDNSKKLETDGSGVTVTGRVAATSYTGDGSSLTGINTDLVSDTTPQLGGTLDLNGNKIDGADSNGSSTNIVILGTGDDLKMYHDGNNSYLSHDNGSGHLYLQGDAIRLRTRAANNNDDYIVCSQGGPVSLYYNDEKKFETEDGGVAVTDDNTSVHVKMVSSAGDSGYLYGSNNDFGLLDGQQHWLVKGVKDGKVELRYDNGAKFETTSYGSRVTGYQTQSSPVAFHAYSNGTISWSNSVIAFNTEKFDYGGNYNTSNYRFTAPVAGLYFFGIRMLFATGFGGLNMKLRKNGSNVVRLIGHTGASNGDAHTGFHIISLSANDYVDIKGSDTHGGVAGGADESAFYGYLIG